MAEIKNACRIFKEISREGTIFNVWKNIEMA
jgi:hypothetical protein